ncbi:MAG: kinase [Thermoplasmatales archaeon]|nr:GHMP kinase [Candidatus Thermoplasmatota archaeon]MCG2825352.1 kinase [Thermoplasmatales archaeon]
MIIRSKAPLRISFGGGGTDVSPYPEERGGAVLSATIDKYAYGTLIPSKSDRIVIKSLDYDIVAKYRAEDLIFNGELDLVKAAIRKMRIKKGVNLFLHSDAPPGSGLGSSSTMVVALVGLFKHWLKKPWTNYDVSELAYKIERTDLGIKGGKQDQYAATFGGFNFIEFNGPTTIVNPLRINRDIINELGYHLLLCYVGRRKSKSILEKQINSYVQKKEDVVKALDETKKIAFEMKNALLQNCLDEFGCLLHKGWMNKKRFTKNITNPKIDKLYALARKNGAAGGKLLGAGGGGYLLLYCDFEKKHVVAEKLEKNGGKIVDFAFENRGLQTWSVRE